MILFWLVFLPVLGGAAAWFAGRLKPVLARWVALAALGLDLGLALDVWLGRFPGFTPGRPSPWLVEIHWPWIPRFGIAFHLGLDGLSLVLVSLAALLGILAVLVSWSEVRERVGFFHFNLLWVLAGIIGVFLAIDLFLFYFFWELMLVPMYFLIGLWGHERRQFAALKFFIFTQAGGLLMLVSILALYFLHGRYTGVYTFEYTDLLGTPFPPAAGFLVMLGFLAAFLVKLPAVPVHTWLPDAHTQAPTAGSVVLAGLLLKTGAYGLLRFVLPLFPFAAREFSPIGMALGVVGILYGAHLAFGQSDLKRLVAYTSVSHMGYILLGAFAMNALALQGAVLQIVSHALSTGALFIVAGILQQRLHTRETGEMGGLWEKVPRLGGAALFFALASLGLPGLGNFVAEFLILAGAFQKSVTLAVLAAAGFIVSTIYALEIIQRVFHGERAREGTIADLDAREVLVLAVLALGLVWLGIYPQPVIRTVAATVDDISGRTATATSLPAPPGPVVELRRPAVPAQPPAAPGASPTSLVNQTSPRIRPLPAIRAGERNAGRAGKERP